MLGTAPKYRLVWLLGSVYHVEACDVAASLRDTQMQAL